MINVRANKKSIYSVLQSFPIHYVCTKTRNGGEKTVMVCTMKPVY